MQFSFNALGTTWWIEVWDEQAQKLDSEIKDFAVQFCYTFEQRYSRFKHTSEISLLNQNRSLTNPKPDTLAILNFGIDLFRRTGGVFNILTGHVQIAHGYDATYSFTERPEMNQILGDPTTDISMSHACIQLKKHAQVDLGGFGKGWCIDQLTKNFREMFGLEQFLINGGGDIYATHHAGKAIEIHLANPLLPGQTIGSTMLKNRAFAASSPHLRRWPTTNGNQHTHIVSTTNHTNRDSVYLTATTAAHADAFATTLLQVDDHTAAQLAAENNLIII